MRYLPKDACAGSFPKWREVVWSEQHKDEGVMKPCYQPEDDGYIVASLTIGMCRLKTNRCEDHAMILCHQCRQESGTVSSY